MAKRNHRLTKVCAHPGCKETAFWNCSTWAEYHQINADNREWKCLRHGRPSAVLGSENKTRVATMVVTEQASGRYFDGVSGFVSGPGFMAYANDFPVGTVLRVTATIEEPTNK